MQPAQSVYCYFYICISFRDDHVVLYDGCALPWVKHCSVVMYNN